MATGGVGDVLTGILAGIASQFGSANWLLALEFGVYLHGLAADMVEEQNPGAPMAATDIIKFLAPAYASAAKEAERA
jgi:NAD(P)H-hydrate repair Nnr-like enzyme with NAD(P)H-hydrate dehydratase domain